MDVSGALTGAGVRAICPSPHKPISLAIWAPLGELVSLEIWGPLSDIALPPRIMHVRVKRLSTRLADAHMLLWVASTVHA